MKNRFIACTGLVLVLLGLIATICLVAFATSARQWVDIDVAVLGACFIGLVGCVFGWISFKTVEGKAAAILGTCLLLFFGYLLIAPGADLPQQLPQEALHLTGDSPDTITLDP
ncbi:MAG: hypothetical protein K8S55_05445 [Phycisphaerae bacterium]|nr:hypothetical protein [Phycisphaerae bacterium]